MMRALPHFVRGGMIMVALWFGHAALRHQFHQHCQSNLLRVVLFANSAACSQMASLLSHIELACAGVLPLLLTDLVKPWCSMAFSELGRLVAAQRPPGSP
jgi:hypothetical protein